MRYLIASLFFANIPQAVYAETAFETGNSLLDKCQSQMIVENGVCYGFLEGISDSLNRGRTDSNFCIPKGVNAAQLKEIFVRFLQNNPNMRHFTAVSLASEIFKTNFNCK